MTSNKPYLIRAIHEWIVDNELTPYLVVDARYPDVQVPKDYVQEGKIVLNISANACRGLHLDNERIVFTVSFGGIPQQVVVTPQAVMAIYAKENGQGMVFTEPEAESLSSNAEKPAAEEPPSTSMKSVKKKPTLKRIK